MANNPSGTVSYTTAANHLSTAVSDFTEYVSRNRRFSTVSTGGEYQYGG